MSSIYLFSKFKCLKLWLAQNLEINVEVSLLRDRNVTTTLCLHLKKTKTAIHRINKLIITIFINQLSKYHVSKKCIIILHQCRIIL